MNTNNKNNLYSVTLVNSPSFAKKLSYTIIGILGLFVLGMFLPWQQNIRSTGELIALNPQDRPQTIPAIISGRIERWYVQEGQPVKKGDTIIFLSEVKEKFIDPEILERLKEQVQAKTGVISATKDKANAIAKQIEALKSGLEFKMAQAQNKIIQNEYKLISDSMAYEAEKVQYEIAKQQFDRQKALYDQGLKSLTEFEQRKLKLQETSAKLASTENKFLATKNELINTKIELNTINAEYIDKISKAESEFNSTLSYAYDAEGDQSKLKNELNSTSIRSSFYYILAPQDGFIIKAIRAGIGEIVKANDPIVTIMPANSGLAAQIYIKPMDLPLVKIGEKVRIEFDGWPALVFSGWQGVSFGTYGGTVSAIDYIANEKGQYRVVVQPDKSDMQWPQLLRVGSGARGYILFKNVPVWYELWRQLNGFPPSVDKPKHVGDKEKNKEKTDEE